MRYEIEDEDTAYERRAQYEADLRTEQLALSAKERAPSRSRIAAGLARFLGRYFENLESRGPKRREQKGTG